MRPGGDRLKGILDEEDARMAVKTGADAIIVSNHGGRQLDGALSSIAALPRIVEAVGDDINIALDFHGRSFSVTEAVRLAQAIEPYHPMFLEEPALTEDPDALVEAKMKTSIPIAGGERCNTRAQLRHVLEKRALHILEPEPTCNGGILETVKWAFMCELYHVVVAPHQACGPVSLLVNCHIDAAIPNFLIQECSVHLDDPFFKDLFHPMPVVKDGCLELPDRPGLGIELNEDAVEKYPRKPYDRPVITGQDGAVGLE